MAMKCKVILMVVVLIFFSCAEEKKRCKVENIVISPVSNVDSTFFNNRKFFQQSLMLDDLTESVDSVAIRINFYYGSLKKELLLDMQFSNSSFTCKLFTLDVDIEPSTKNPIVEKRSVKSFRRFFRHDAILDSISKYGLFEIRTDDEIPNWGWGLHREGWIVQYANCKQYRIYSNNSFLDKYNMERQPEAKNIANVIRFLESELDVELIPNTYY